MKKMILCTAISLAAMAFTATSAQVRVNANVNVGSQPNWGPGGYDYVNYYYLPDIETYYEVPTRQFIYLSGRNWVFAYGLSPAYRSYNLHSGYKVVVNQPNAYRHYHSHKVKYAKYKGYKSRGYKGGNYSNGRGHGNGKGKGRGRY